MACPRLVLFDLDGTLLDGAGLPAAMRRTGERLAAQLPGVTADDVVGANTGAWQRLWSDAEDDYLLGGRDGDAITEDAWRATLDAVGGAHLLDAAVADWREEEQAAFRLYDDVVPALDALDRVGIRVGLLSNGAASVQRRKLDAVGIGRRFDPLVISGAVGLRKPDPQVFGVALHRAGVDPEDAWYVGDNLWHDVAPATEAGLRTVWLDRHGVDLQPDWPRPTAVLTTLDGLAARLQDPR